ncbi:MAG: sulfite exporter TauE/SafE family protein [Candidatus Bathyarchaeota archaeon]|nr:sulfite exporter TauE/SafE family protein [Candidatus Bathyarchaeota archaeon]MDH5494805.1 sulfite exporter TauE/SafE family protein [Candidatus Bathyarchaeota archaeon]
MNRKTLLLTAVLLIIGVSFAIGVYSYTEAAKSSWLKLDAYMTYEQLFIWTGHNETEYMTWNITKLGDNFAELHLISNGVNVTEGNVALTTGEINWTINTVTREIVNSSDTEYIGEKWPLWIETNVTTGSTIDIFYGINDINRSEQIYVFEQQRDCWVVEYNWATSNMERWYDKSSGICLKIHVVLYYPGTTIEITETAVSTNVDLYAYMTVYEVIFLPVLALFVGIIAAMLGIGGGVFIVPALQLLPLSIEFSPQIAAGTSLAMIVFKALSSTSSYVRQERIDYKVGLFLATVTVPGAFLGAYLTAIIAKELLILIFALFILYVASRMIFSYSLSNFKLLKSRKTGWTRRLVDSEGKVFDYIADMKIGLPLSFFAGVSSGLLGIGGGALLVPILHFALSFPMHLAVATSVFIMIFTSLSGVVTHLSLGNVQFGYALLLGVGVIFGAQMGAYVSRRVSSKNLQRIFGLVLVFVSLRMILKFLGWA